MELLASIVGWAALPAAVVAALRCWAAARRAAGEERIAWVWLGLGAAAAAAAPAGVLAGGVGSAAALVAYLGAASLGPMDGRRRALRPVRVLDPLLLGLVLATAAYQARVYGAESQARWTAPGAAAVLAVAASAWLWRRTRAEQTAGARPDWRLPAAALAQGAAAAIRLRAADTAGGALLELAACVLLALAARPPAAAERPVPEAGPASLRRAVFLPAAAFFGVAAVTLGPALCQGSPPASALLMPILLYISAVLVRQTLVELENRRLSRTLQQESIRLRLVVDNIHDAVVTEDLHRRIIFASDRFLQMFGVEREQVLGRPLEDFIHPEDRPLPAVGGEGSVGPFLPMRTEFRGSRRDGAVLFLESSFVPVRIGGLLVGYQSLIRDISERRRAEERQREMVQRLEFFVNHMPLACIVFDTEFRVLEWNRAATAIFGWTAEEAFGRNGLELLVPAEHRPAVLARWEELVATRSANQGSNPNRTKDGRVIECEWFNTSLVDHSGRVVAMASMAQDITERRNLEAQLRQSQKMEAVGVLAGGVAHDFNNLLTVIAGNLSLAQMRLGDRHPAARGLRDAERAAERAAGLVRQLLDFSRKSRSQPRPLSLNDCVRETLSLLRSSLDRRIALEQHADPDLWLAEADPGQIHQVLVNLCVNARDAMPEGGTLRITCANRVIDEAYCRAHPEARPGEFVELRVADTGHGMDRQTLARIFEPFFTTKEVGKGTGLGLAMAYGIVRQHGGWITVESAPGQGSTFAVLLPRTLASAEEPVPETAGPSGGTETILLVDDEEMLLRLGRAILEANGHRVIEARDGQEALEIFRSRRAEIDLVLLDMIMPRRNGRDTLEELHTLAPEVPVVLSSGYTPVSNEELNALGARAFLHKPYRPAELVRTVRQVLDSVAAARETAS